MDISTYEKLWELSIKPKIDRMLASDNYIIYAGGQVKEKIWLAYENTKNTIHTYMQNPDGRIDRHKVASIMLYSIIANKPFELKILPLNQTVSGFSILANETLAVNTALAIVQSFILTDATLNSDKIKYEIFEKGFIFPECQHEDYLTHLYKMLYYAKYNQQYDIFAFSHVLFLIEAYTELVKRTELAGKVL